MHTHTYTSHKINKCKDQSPGSHLGDSPEWAVLCTVCTHQHSTPAMLSHTQQSPKLFCVTSSVCCALASKKTIQTRPHTSGYTHPTFPQTFFHHILMGEDSDFFFYPQQGWAQAKTKRTGYFALWFPPICRGQLSHHRLCHVPQDLKSDKKRRFPVRTSHWQNCVLCLSHSKVHCQLPEGRSRVPLNGPPAQAVPAVH